MKRIVLVLFIALLPLQAALAAVCAYCDHAAGNHSLHASIDDVTASLDEDAQRSAVDGLDASHASGCSLCHHGVVTPLPAHPLKLAVDSIVEVPQHTALLYHPSHIDRIERVPLHAAALI